MGHASTARAHDHDAQRGAGAASQLSSGCCDVHLSLGNPRLAGSHRVAIDTAGTVADAWRGFRRRRNGASTQR